MIARRNLIQTCLPCAVLLLPPLWSGPAWAGSYTFTSVIDNTGQFSVFLDKPAINSSGVVVFHAQMKSGVQGIYRSDGTTLTTIVDTGSGEFSFSAGRVSLESRPDIDDDGTVAFFIYHVLGNLNSAPGIRTGSGGATVIIAESSSTGPFYDAFSNPSIRNGVVSFRGGINGNGNPHGIFTMPAGGGSYTIIAQDGGKFLSTTPFNETSINASGQVAYVGDLTNYASGVFVGPDAATTIALTGPGSQFSSLYTFPKISDNGAVVFWANLTDLSGGDFMSSGDAVTQIAVAGGGEADDQFPSINAAGTVACFGRLSSGERAVLAGTGPVVDKVIAAGDSLFGSTVVGLGEPGNNGLNNNGQIVFTYSLENGVEGVAIATPANGPATVLPALQIHLIDSLHIGLAWTTNSTGFGLESASSLPAAIWNPVTNTPVWDGEQSVVVLEMGNAPQFFRLHKP